MPRKFVLATLLIATVACPQQLFAAPHTGLTAWLDELVTRLVTVWEAEATDLDSAELIVLTADSELSEDQPPEASDGAPEEEPPIANIHPGWDPIG